MTTAAAPVTRVVVTRDIILNHARALPAAPQVLAGLCELLEDLNTDLDQISAEIRLEPALAARVIRISNSPVFGGGQRIGSVDEAVNRVGFSEVLRLVGAATVAGLVDRSLTCYAVPAEQLRESLLFHALASEALADRLGVDPRMAYSAGLLRAIGMMVLDREGRSKLGVTGAYDPKSFPCYQDWESARFGLVATDVTTMILDEWRFPAEMVTSLQQHVTLGDAALSDPLACVLNLAGAVVASHQKALPGELPCWELTEEKLAAAGLDADQFAEASGQAFAVFERHKSALS